MTKDEKQTGKVSEAMDLVLAREIRNLDPEIQPGRDLWPAIERNIADFQQAKKRVWTENWQPYGIAASLVIAVAALTSNFVTPNQTEFGQTAANTGSFAIDNIGVEYLKVRNPLLDQFKETNKSLAPETLEDLFHNIQLMELARRDIEVQLREHPESRRLVEMLMRIHQQEIELLQQDYSKPGRSM